MLSNKKKEVTYVVLRYLTFVIQFVVSVFIAKRLDANLFGYYSLINLVLQYTAFLNFGITYSLNVTFVAKQKNLLLSEKIWQNSVLIQGISAVLLTILFLLSLLINESSLRLNIGAGFFLTIFLIASFANLNNLFVNLFRVLGKFKAINFFQSIIPVITALFLFFFEGKSLFYLALGAMGVGNVIAFCYFMFHSPLQFRGSYNRTIFRILVKRGWYLLLYNLSFYILFLICRTLVSMFFDIPTFGLFSFAYSLSNAIILFFSAITFILFPSYLAKLDATKDYQGKEDILNEIRKLFLTGVAFVSLVACSLMPALFYIVPKYSTSYEIFKLLLLGQVFLNNTFGYSTFLVSLKKERKLMIYGFESVLVFLVLSIFTLLFCKSIFLLCCCVILCCIYYNLRISFFTYKILEKELALVNLLKATFPPRIFFPFFLLAFCLFFPGQMWFSLLALVILCVLNIRTLGLYKKKLLPEH